MNMGAAPSYSRARAASSRRSGRSEPLKTTFLGFGRAAVGTGVLGAFTILLFVMPVSSSLASQHIVASGEYGKEGPKSTGLGGGCRLAYQEVDPASRPAIRLEDRRSLRLAGKRHALGGGFPINAGINSGCGDPDLEVDDSGGSSSGNIYATPSNTSIYGWSSSGSGSGRVPGQRRRRNMRRRCHEHRRSLGRELFQLAGE